MPRYCRAHCPHRGLCFTSDAAFDAHLGGERAGWQRLDPGDVAKLRQVEGDATVCKVSFERAQHGRVEGMTLWELGAQVDRARRHQREGRIGRVGSAQEGLGDPGGTPTLRPSRAA
jgi:hypothetical protein